MKIKKKHIFRFFGPFFSSFIIFGWDFVENEKNHQKSTVILLQFWLSKQKNYFWSHAKLAKMSSFQCTVGGGLQQRSTPACESSQGCIEKRCKENIHLAQRYIIPQTKLSSLDESLGLLDCIGIFPPLEPLAYAQCDIKGREGFHFDFGWNALAFRGKRLATATKF